MWKKKKSTRARRLYFQKRFAIKELNEGEVILLAIPFLCVLFPDSLGISYEYGSLRKLLLWGWAILVPSIGLFSVYHKKMLLNETPCLASHWQNENFFWRKVLPSIWNRLKTKSRVTQHPSLRRWRGTRRSFSNNRTRGAVPNGALMRVVIIVDTCHCLPIAVKNELASISCCFYR